MNNISNKKNQSQKNNPVSIKKNNQQVKEDKDTDKRKNVAEDKLMKNNKSVVEDKKKKAKESTTSKNSLPNQLKNSPLSYLKYLSLVLIISLLIIFGLTYLNKNKVYDYSNDNISLQYDNTWQLQDTKSAITLIHKKTKSKISIQVKELELKYTESSLNDIIEDIKTSIEKQNTDYHLINEEKDTSYKDTIYNYLYEKDQEQVLVNIRKKNNKIAIIYYQAESPYFDIILDSVDNILDSVELTAGQRIK